MNDNISPEEKLLKLIRDKKKKAPVQQSQSSASGSSTAIKFAAEKLVPPSFQKYLLAKGPQNIIMFVFAVSCIYLIISLLYPRFGLKNIKLPDISQEESAQLKAETKEEIKPYQFYQDALKNRQIFTSITQPETEAPSTAISADLVKDLNLIGIISGESPQAIIEDKKNIKTYYVTKGKYIGEFQVEDIQEGKVILNYKGQKFELYL